MSVQANTYLMCGVVRRYDEWKDKYKALEPYMDSAFTGIEHHNRLCVLYDGMNGKYVAIGRVLAKTGNGDGFDEPIKIIEPDDVDEIQEAVSMLVGTPLTVGMFVLTHYR